MDQKFDVIIVGGGPNGLIIASYLAKAGQKCLLLEKRFEVGGGLMTEQVTLPDFFHNTHAVYHMMVDYAPIYADLDFDEYLVKHIRPKLQWAMPLKDGKCLCIYTDVEKTCASIAKFSKKDADTYRKMHKLFDEMMKAIGGPQTYYPMGPAPLMAAHAEATELGRQMYKMAEKTPEEVVCEMYENDHVRTLMLYAACHWGLDHSQSGVGFMLAIYMDRLANYYLVAGGSHRISNAILKRYFENKGQVRTSAQIKRFIIENGTAKGVEMEDGTQYLADKAVVSTIDPHQTFLKYVGEKNLDPELVEMLRIWQWDKWSLFDVHLALSEPPQFKAAASDPEINQAFIYLLGYDNLASLKHHWDEMRQGKIPDHAGFNACFPSVHDPYQAPPGNCAGLISQMACYDLKDGGHEKWLNRNFREEYMWKQVAKLQQYAPNMTKDKVLQPYITTPADIQNKFANMVKGGYKQGAYHPLQMGYLRPNQYCSQYRTPIKNLYVGGASVAPGGCVIWGPGYNCANAVAEDFSIKKWWTEPKIVTEAIKNNYIMKIG
jgi:phytoene dehydrogenase-like protein